MSARCRRSTLCALAAVAFPLAAVAEERALERALVQEGGLVLSPWGLELVPELSFAHSDGAVPATAGAGVAPLAARSEVLTAALTYRVGLPLDVQAEVSVPFVLARVTPSGDDPTAGVERAGIGDVRVGVTWHALRGREPLPDVLAGGFWKSRTGRTAFDDPSARVPLGTGVEQFGGTLALVKAVDPLVLLARGTYAVSAPRWIPQGWLEAGAELGASAGAVLAVSPEATLSFALEALRVRPHRLDGRTADRADRTSAVLRIGIGSVTSRRGFLQVNLGIGLTSDVPQVEVGLAAPLEL